MSTARPSGGPGAGPIAVTQALAPYLPAPIVARSADGYRLDHDRPQSIGRVRSFFGNVGILVTKTLVISGDPLSSTQPGHPRGAYLHAYDKLTGAELGKVWMPAPQSGSPMTYSYQGQQYIVVAVSGGNYSGEYIAYRLPTGN